jgi:hypothetical protein
MPAPRYRMNFYSAAPAASGDQDLLAAPPAGSEYVLAFIGVQNASSTATTWQLKAGASIFMRMLDQNQGDGVALVFPPGQEIRLGSGNKLVLNLSGANAHNVSIGYWTESALV